MVEVPPDFGTVDTEDGLIAASRTYARSVIEDSDLAVSLEPVSWSISKRAKRRAACVECRSIPGTAVGTPIDWDTTAENLDTTVEALKNAEVRLTLAAFDAFETSEWKETIRHELVHLEQFQQFGTTDHGRAFRRRAKALDAPLRCQPFTPPKFIFRCRACGTITARRYRACKLSKHTERYRSQCCQATIECTQPEG